MATSTAAQQKSGQALGVTLVTLLAGAAVAVAIGVFGSQHQPSGLETFTLGFGSTTAMKVWLGSVAGVLAMGQLLSALWLYGKLGSRRAPRALGVIHRFSGGMAVAVSLPVAYSCLWSLGFQSYDTRVLVHSLLGCVFYGAFVTKVIALHTKSPGWMLPLAGGLLVASLVGLVLASSVWYLATVGVPPSAGGY